MKTKKGATSLVTGILILVLSVVVMISILALVSPFFNNLTDSLNYRKNKENLFYINQQFLELKGLTNNSFIYLNIKTDHEINFDAITNTITIIQPLKNESKEFKEQIFENITITKKNTDIEYKLNLNGIIDLNESLIVNNNQKLKLIISENTNIPIINIEKMSPNLDPNYYFENESDENLFLILELNNSSQKDTTPSLS